MSLDHVGDVLRLIRERSGHTMGDLARFLGVSVTVVSDIEMSKMDSLLARVEPRGPPVVIDVIHRRVAVTIDPNPCNLYRWREPPCPGVYSGSHACKRDGGHAGGCVCFYCGALGRGKDRSDPPVTS